MPTLTIDGYAPITVDDSFTELSPEDQKLTVDEILADLTSKGIEPSENNRNPDGTFVSDEEQVEFNEGQDSDWIGQTVGGTGGAAAGAWGGASLGFATGPFAPIAVPLFTLLGGIGGGYAGGFGGEFVEQSIDNYKNSKDGAEMELSWAGLSDQQRKEVWDAGLEEGLWGAAPGAGGVLSKGGRLVFKQGYNNVVSWLGQKLSGLKGIKEGATNAASRTADRVAGYGVKGQAAKSLVHALGGIGGKQAIEALPSSKIINWAGGLNTKAKESVVNNLIDGLSAASKKVSTSELAEQVTKEYASRGVKLTPEEALEVATTEIIGKYDDALQLARSIKNKGAKNISEEDLLSIFQAAAGNEAVEAVLKKWGVSDIGKSAAITAGVTGGLRGLGEYAVETHDPGPDHFNKGGEIEDKRKNKLRLLHSEGYDPKQSYAIMKSYEERGKLNRGGKVLPRYEGGGLVNQAAAEVVEGAHIPDTIVSSIPVGSYIVNAAAANHPQFKRELLEMGGKVIENDFNPKFGKDYVQALVGAEEIYLNPHITKKNGNYLDQVNQWGRDVKRRLGT